MFSLRKLQFYTFEKEESICDNVSTDIEIDRNDHIQKQLTELLKENVSIKNEIDHLKLIINSLSKTFKTSDKRLTNIEKHFNEL